MGMAQTMTVGYLRGRLLEKFLMLSTKLCFR